MIVENLFETTDEEKNGGNTFLSWIKLHDSELVIEEI